LISTLKDKRRNEVERRVLECAYHVSMDIGYVGDYFNDKVY
jgi:hypothetical protein